MIFPTKYIALSQNVFKNKEFQISPIRFKDRLDIMKWRNEQMYHLRQSKVLTLKDQENYFKNVISKLFSKKKPNQLLFSFFKNNNFIGYGGLVHIDWKNKSAEISFIMKTTLEKKYFQFYWKKFLQLIEKPAFEDIKLHKLNTYAFDIRPQLYLALEESGYKKEAVLENQCFINNMYKNVIIHSKKNYEIFI